MGARGSVKGEPPTPSPSGHRRRLVFIGKLVVGLGLLAFLITRSDPARLLGRLMEVRVGWLALVLVLPHVGIALSSLKWRLLLRERGIRTGFGRLFALYMIGTFFNNFLPTMVGGDVVKAYHLGRESGDHSAVAAATFMERYVGFGALVSLLPLAVLHASIVESWPWIRWAALAIVGLYASTLAVFLRVGESLTEFSWEWKPVGRFLSAFRKTGRRVRAFRRSLPVVGVALGISLAFYLVTGVASWAAARSVGTEVALWYMIGIIPWVLLGGLLPVSLNGLGITEAGYVLFLGLAGIPTVDAVAMGLVLRGRVFITAILGGVIFLVYGSSGPAPTNRGGGRRGHGVGATRPEARRSPGDP